MAYVLDPNKDKDEEEKQGQQPQGGPEQIVSGQSGQIGAGAGQTGQAAAAPKATGAGAATRSGSWTNLSTYTKANQGNDAAMGQKVQGAVNETGQQAQAQRGTYGQAAQNAATASTVTDQGIIDQLKASPTAVNKDQFAKQYNATYSGPQDYTRVEGYQPTAQAQKATAQFADQATGNQSQRATALARNDVYGRPSYTRGERNLDSFILGSGQAGQKALQDVRQNYGDGSAFRNDWEALVKQIGGAGEADSLLGKAKATTEKTAVDTKAAFKGAVDPLAAELEALGLTAKDKSGAQDKVAQAIASGDVEQLKAFGFKDEEIEFMKNSGFDRNKLVKGGVDYTIGDLASETQSGNWKALSDLGAAIGDPTLGQRFGGLAKGGGSDISVDQELLTAIQQGAGLGKTLEGKLKGAEAAGQRAEDYWTDPEVRNATLLEQGLTQEEIDWAVANGIPPEAFIAGADELTVGGTAGDDIGSYNALAEKLGIQGLDPEAVLGATAKFDTGKIQGIKDAAKIQTGLTAKAKAANDERAGIRDSIASAFERGDVKSLARRLGIDRQTAQYAIDLGVNPMDFLTAGRELGAGDFAGDATRENWGELLKMLGPGVGAGFDINDQGADGDAFAFDETALKKAIIAADQARRRG